MVNRTLGRLLAAWPGEYTSSCRLSPLRHPSEGGLFLLWGRQGLGRKLFGRGFFSWSSFREVG